MLVLTLPWHLVGLLGMPRRMAYYDYTRSGARAAGLDGDGLDRSAALLLVVSAVLFVWVLARASRRATSRRSPAPYTFSRAVHEDARVPLRCSTASACGSR